MLNERALKRVIERGKEIGESFKEEKFTLELINEVFSTIPAREGSIIMPVLNGEQTFASTGRNYNMVPSVVRAMFLKDLDLIFYKTRMKVIFQERGE